MLAIDGGGIRGILALGILERLERELRAESGSPDYVLADYFDAIAGTSTGAIIASGLSIGLSVGDLIDFYMGSGRDMFSKARLSQRLRFQYSEEPLARTLRSVFGDLTLGSDALRTVLLLVMRNATTDSPWPLTNNPHALYNRRSHPGCNLDLPLWQLVRASTAAPVFFPPETIAVAQHRFQFVDGGVTMYNNPAFKLFLMMTVDRYWQDVRAEEGPWQSGADRLLLISVGTGTLARGGQINEKGSNILFNVASLPSQLIFSAMNEQDMLCRIFGDCVAGDPLDREVDRLIGSHGPLAEKLFRYARYNADLAPAGLEALGCGHIRAERVQKMDSIDATQDLLAIGRAVAAATFSRDHFAFDRFPVTMI